MTASINTDSGVGPFATREDALLEGEAVFILTVLACIPDVTGEHLAEERLGAAREVGVLGDSFGSGEMGSHHHSVGFNTAFTHLFSLKRHAQR